MVHKMEWYIGSEWNNAKKGLNKKVLELMFSKVEKPHAVANVIINIEKVENLGGRESKYLIDDNLQKPQEMEMGTALTAVDCYLELLVQQMMVGEKALCTIKTKGSEELRITLTLEKILQSQSIHALNPKEMYDLALKYKENGVKIYKSYPLFAHAYFVKAAKCLISYKDFEHLTVKNDGISGKDMKDLLIQVQTNLSACLLSSKRYEDVVYLTKFVETLNSPSEKSVYRRAMAYYHLEEFETALKTMEKIPDYKDKKDFANLCAKINESKKCSDARYKGMVQKMFS